MKGNASTQAGFAPDVVDALLEHAWAMRPADPPCMLVGLSALQGSGKSTLAAQLASAANDRGLPSVVLGLDDFYLGRGERLQLARRIHPLLVTRGVPGTHDIGLLESMVDALRTKTDWSPLRIPRFDKGRDTRLPQSRWRWIRNPPRLIFLEGWCVGVDAESEEALVDPVNTLEREEDADRRWRRWVNQQLADTYCGLWRRLDRLFVLQAPGFGVVRNWRDEQEHVLRARGAIHAMPSSSIARFLADTERLSLHALGNLPPKADLLVELGRQREVLAISRPERPAA